MPKKNQKKSKEEIIDQDNQEDTTPESEAEEAAEVLEGEVLEEETLTTEEKLELTQAALEASEAKAAEYLDGWQRAKAEFTNYRKRQERERELSRFESVGRIAKRYLPIVDDLDRALKDRPTEGDGAAWAEGIELVARKLGNILEAEGITLMEADGEMFDPNLHEAVAQTESDEHESGQIIEVLQPGYRMGERVLRPAIVRIAA